ncbi:phasin family protein [Reinekea marinisedimentorum]|uniref:Poly(Hydroxyalkanoate) granule-associated protein n=1 Tax=Reinekea marinisedimentorum TaxID=230495 RepID=A0A4R3I9D2_9GAMM|nr:phasin family protein [Reinekea marinisedimentorum]TCS41992.1 poly(hydroxyalkanoate) granule-associated protein [Reinekea marinisedimentorum]
MKKDSFAQQIWYAGLGVIARAESENTEWLQDFIKEGEKYEEARIDELKAKLSQFEDKTVGSTKRKFDDIEKSFESKVSQSLSKVGLMSKSEFETLKEKLEQLEQQINDLKS